MIKKLLATRSTDEANPTVGGHAYFISDGSPVPNFEILRPLCTARGCVYPTFVIPTVVLLYLSFVMEQVHFRLKSWGVSFQPFLLQAEVQKVGVTHYCSIEAAKTHFGYKPLFDTAEGARRLAVYYGQKKRLDNRNFFRLSPLGVWLLVLIPMTQLFVTAYSLAGSNPVLQVMDTAGMWILPYRSAHEWIFWLAVATHTGEALYAHHLASDMGCKNTAILWAIQTVFLGYGSFMLLYKRKAFLAKAVNQGLTGSAGSSSDSIDDEDRKYTNSASNGKVSRMTRSASKPSDKQAR